MSNKVIAGFELVEKLGEGGAGAVYKARQLSLGRMVAIKVLPPHSADNPEQIERFKKEAQTAAQLKHQGIVQVYEAGQDGETSFIAMEFVNGYSVGDWIQRRGHLEPQDVVAVGLNVAKALDYAWQKARLIHLDIKPDNLLVDEDGTVKVADLGLALMLEREPAPGEEEELQCTPNYAPPELIRGTPPPDCRADIYSLGASMYHMATGVVPFDGLSGNQVLEMHLGAHLDDPHKVNPGVPPALSLLLRKMMARSPDFRYPDWAAVAADMERVAGGGLPFAPLPDHVDCTIEYRPLPADPSKSGLSKKGGDRRLIVKPGTPHSPSHSSSRHGKKAPSLMGPIVLLLIVAIGGLVVWKVADGKKNSTPQPAQRAADDLRQGYEAAQQYAREKPEDIAGIQRQFDEIARKAEQLGRRDYADNARAQVQSARSAHAERCRQVMEEVGRLARLQEAKGDFDAAMNEYRNYRGPFAGSTQADRMREADQVRQRRDAARPPVPPPSSPVALSAGLPAEVASLHAKYVEGIKPPGNEKASRAVFAEELDALVKTLTKGNRIDDAIQVRDYLRNTVRK